METIKYKGFIGSVEVSLEDDCIVHGKILHINDLVTYESESPKDIKKEFMAAVDDYLETCKELGIEAHKSFGGSLNVRIGPELHKELSLLAIKKDKKINALIKEAVQQYLYNKNNESSEIHNHFHYSDTQPLEAFNPRCDFGIDDRNPYQIVGKKRQVH